MKTRHLLSLVAATVLRTTAPAADLPPQIKQLADRYDQTASALAAGMDAQLKPLGERYLTQLTNAQRTAVAGAKFTEAAAINSEIADLQKDALRKDPAPTLPKRLLADRRAYLSADANARRDEPAVEHAIDFFTSANLKEWTLRSQTPGLFECPDMFELPEYPIPPVVKPSGPINIDVGRQLFVDDWLIAETTLQRAFHQAKIHDAPVLKAETKLEREGGTAEGAVLFDGGVWFDPKDQLFKMWYAAGFRDGIALATSRDGIHWDRPQLDVSPGENRVLKYQKGWALSGFSVARDPHTNDASQRFKMLAYHRYKDRWPGDVGDDNPAAKMYVSADGIHWDGPQMVKPFTGDNPSMFFDPFRGFWVFSTRNRAPSVLRPGAVTSDGKPVTVRARFRFDGPDFIQTGLTANGAKLWLKPDEQDKADPEFNIDPELYKFGAVAYESIMLGAVGMFYGPQNDVAKELKRPKIIDIQLAYSRDGVNYPRPSRDAFIAAARQPGTWNRTYLHSANGVCLIVGDELWFYFGACSGQSQREGAEIVMAGGSVGLAKLRRDGFASMDANASGGTLTTVPVTFTGKFPFVNIAAKDGELRVEILDGDGKVIAPFSKENCTPIQAGATKQRVAWKGTDDLSALAGKPVRFRFHLKNAQIYAFWVSAKENGASGGYVAAGGPEFAGPTDN